MRPLRPCIERLPNGVGCPLYSVPGKPRCAEHERQAVKEGRRSPGTTGAWRKARNVALKRAAYKCEKCGRTEAQARAAGTWLEVHHLDGAGVRATRHDASALQVLCREPCHLETFRAKARPTWQEIRMQTRTRIEKRD